MAPRLQADIPTVDDSVAKLMHMGRETCRKLADLHSAAQQANMELDLDEHLACVEKVCVCGGGSVLLSSSACCGPAGVYVECVSATGWTSLPHQPVGP